MRFARLLTTAVTLTLIVDAAIAGAQTPANDASARLRQVLPADVAARVLAIIARARTQELPADALENRALKFAARGVPADSIERSVVEHESRMARVREVLRSSRGTRPADDEIEAAADVMRRGVDGAGIAELAKSAPSGRSLAVPFYVVGSLVDRGMNSAAAIKRIEQRLNARASDRDLEKLPSETPANTSDGDHRPASNGRALGETKHPGNAFGAQNGNGSGGPPAGVPANGGAHAKPTPPGQANKPTTPPGKKP